MIMKNDTVTEDFRLALVHIKQLIESHGEAAIEKQRNKKNERVDALSNKVAEFELLRNELKRISGMPNATQKDFEAQRAMMWQVKQMITDDEEEES